MLFSIIFFVFDLFVIVVVVVVIAVCNVFVYTWKYCIYYSAQKQYLNIRRAVGEYVRRVKMEICTQAEHIQCILHVTCYLFTARFSRDMPYCSCSSFYVSKNLIFVQNETATKRADKRNRKKTGIKLRLECSVERVNRCAYIKKCAFFSSFRSYMHNASCRT